MTAARALIKRCSRDFFRHERRGNATLCSPGLFRKYSTKSRFNVFVAKRWPRLSLTGGATIVCATYFAASVIDEENESWEELKRPWIFWTSMFPIYLKYRFTQFKIQQAQHGLLSNLVLDQGPSSFLLSEGDIMIHKNMTDADEQEIWESLHQRYATQVLDIVLRLRGIYVKVGQICCTRSDILPLTYRKTLDALFDRIPALSSEDARAIIETSLGRPIHDVFESFDDNALGAASIGQVHRAKLKDGRDVVVKLQYGERAKQIFQRDMITIRQFVKIAQPEQEPVLDETERQFISEYDFRKEAWALQTIRENVMPVFPSVVIPKPVPELCTRDVCVMEYLDGEKVVDAVTREYERLAKSMGTSLDALRAQMENEGRINVSKWHLISAYLKNSVMETVKYWSVLSWNYSVGWISRKQMEYPAPPINHSKLLNTLIQVHGHQILIDGVFNGDPHPGNVFLLKDGRIGLIDYGQVKTLSPYDRRQFARMILLLCDDRGPEIIALAKQLGFETEKNDDYVLYKTIQVALDTDDPKVTNGRSIQQFMEELSRRDRTKKLPEQYIMACRVSILLRGLGTLLQHPPISIAHAWKPFAEQALKLFPEGAENDNVAPNWEDSLRYRESKFK